MVPLRSIVELVKLIVAPVLGMPFAVKLALNQMYVPALICVPLKLDGIVDDRLQLCVLGQVI